MLRQIITITGIFLCTLVAAQHTVRFEIQSLPPYHASGADIYITGSFNGWNPKNEGYKFTQSPGGNYTLTLQLQPGMYEYKFTRGGWDKVESGAGGADLPNRFIKVEGNENLQLHIDEWKDRYPPAPKASTASKNVQIIDTTFYIPQLKRTRRVWIYLPEGYEQSKNRYPVLYMHDGQNVFDEVSSYSGEWGVDEFLDSTSLKKCIVVGIDNGGLKRLNEYCPYDFSLKGIAANYESGKGEGKKYAAFLVKTLKPFIDKKYRTLKDKDHTFIAGSSMGGLISLFTVLQYPKVFGGAGVFSPAFWIGPAIKKEVLQKGKAMRTKIYLMAGEKENETMVPDMLDVFNRLRKYASSPVNMVIRAEGRHHESTWRKEFPLFYTWMLSGE
jgi:predicted alpha/beta superfamily hydrolase